MVKLAVLVGMEAEATVAQMEGYLVEEEEILAALMEVGVVVTKEVEVVGEADRGRAKIFLERCKAGLAKEERNMQKRKVGMRKAFHGDSGGGGGGSKGKSKVKGKSKGKEKDEDEEGDAAAATATSLMAEAATQEEPPKPKMLPVYALMLGFFVIFIGIAKAGLAAIGAGGPSYLDRLKDQDREIGLPEF